MSRRSQQRAGLRRVIALALLVTSAGCSSEAETFKLRLRWAEGGAQACPHPDGAAPSCATIPVSCSVRVLVRITNETGTDTLYSSCHLLEDLTNACGLAELPLEASAPLVNGMARVQVAVWPNDQLTPHERLQPNLANGEIAVGACPTDVTFDLAGLPNLGISDAADAWRIPALGGEIYFPIGDRRVAEVELGCPRYDLLDTAACQRPPPQVVATIRDPQSWASVPANAPITVRFGAPSFGADGWSLNLVDSEQLERSIGGEVTWTARIEGAAPELACVQVQVFAAGTAPVAACQDVEVVDGVASVLGFAVNKPLVDKLRRLLGLSEFPSTGMVLGVVVDDRNARVVGARVVSPVEVVYPTDDFQQIGLNETSANGTFLSTTAPFDTTWAAQAAGGIGDDGTARGGLLAEHLTVVVIRMNRRIGGVR